MDNQILIVDDEKEICNIIARRLVMENYLCVTATTGKEALQYFYKNQFSLVICDIKIPEMDGLRLLENLKAIDPETIIIMMTGYPDIDIVIKALRLGAYDFFVKPFNLELLVFTIKKAFEKKILQEKLNMMTNIYPESCVKTID